MRLVNGAKYAALQTRYQRTARELEDTEKLAAKRLATINRLRAERDQLRDAHPDTPVQQPQSVQGDVELRRQLHLARKAMAALDQQCRDLQRVNELQDRQLRGRAEREASAS